MMIPSGVEPDDMRVYEHVDDIEFPAVADTHDSVQWRNSWRWQHC